MQSIPTDGKLDASLNFYRDPYRYISRTCDRLGTDVFATRLLLEPTVCLRGAAAAQVFYDRNRFTRIDAAPRRLQNTLFGHDGVQSLDGEAHRLRKARFMRLMSAAAIERLVHLAGEEWSRALRAWQSQPEVRLLDEAERLLFRAVCRWSDVPFADGEVNQRAAEFAALFEAPASIGPRYVRGRLARKRANAWAAAVIEQARAGAIEPAPGTALYEFAFGHDGDGAGERLDTQVAAVELLNVLRPTVAIAVYIVDVAIALEDHPEARERLQAGDTRYRHGFVQEVRRCAPFFPFTAARVRERFVWRGYEFAAGTRVLLDLWGTDVDPRRWPDPLRFDPARFDDREPDPFDLIPQGGGDHWLGHRCAGEWVTIALLEQAADVLARAEYRAPAPIPRPDLSRPPAEPPDGFTLRPVRHD